MVSWPKGLALGEECFSRMNVSLVEPEDLASSLARAIPKIRGSL